MDKPTDPYRDDPTYNAMIDAVRVTIAAQAHVIRLSSDLESAKRVRDFAIEDERRAREAWAQSSGLGKLTL